MNKTSNPSTIRVSRNWLVILASIFLALGMGVMITRFSLTTNGLFYAAIILGLLTLVKIEYGIYIALLLSVIGGLFGFDLPGVPPIYFVEIMLTILLLVWFASILTHHRELVSSPVNKPLIMILLWSIVSMIGAQYMGTVTSRIQRFGGTVLSYKFQINTFTMLFFTIASYFVVVNHISNKQVAKHMIFSIIISSIPMSIYQYYLFFTQTGMRIGYIARVYSFMGGNGLGGFYMVVLLLLITLLFYYKDAVKRILLITMICLIGFNIMITFARASLLATGVAIISFIFFKNRKISVGLLVCIALLFVFTSLAPTISEIYRLDQISSGTGHWARIAIAKDAIEIIKNHPVLGIGLGRYFDYSHYWQSSAHGRFHYYGSAHNDYLQMGVYMGIVGLGLFFWFIWAVGKEAISFYKSTEDDFYKSISLSFLAIFTGFLVGCLASESIFGSFENMGYQSISCKLYFWVLLGILIGMKNLEARFQSDR